MPALYVIRHAEPAVRGVLLGRSDPPLSEVGLRQAAALPSLLPRCAAVYTSPLQRARQTANFLSGTTVILSELAEISYGEWDGLSWTDIERKSPEIAAEKLKRWRHIVSPGGEPWESFQTRVCRALAVIRSGPFPAAIVAHEAVNAVIMNNLTEAALESYKQDYCTVKKYNVRSGT
ncbi:MAG TPA: histidine phosphatase family protein [Bryobacteraceae bacterium]|nr:histidine phosphatase family protein [Bryobacteraceae bacterium]